MERGDMLIAARRKSGRIWAEGEPSSGVQEAPAGDVLRELAPAEGDSRTKLPETAFVPGVRARRVARPILPGELGGQTLGECTIRLAGVPRFAFEYYHLVAALQVNRDRRI